jgi:hypothetical protein
MSTDDLDELALTPRNQPVKNLPLFPILRHRQVATSEITAEPITNRCGPSDKTQSYQNVTMVDYRRVVTCLLLTFCAVTTSVYLYQEFSWIFSVYSTVHQMYRYIFLTTKPTLDTQALMQSIQQGSNVIVMGKEEVDRLIAYFSSLQFK